MFPFKLYCHLVYVATYIMNVTYVTRVTSTSSLIIWLVYVTIPVIMPSKNRYAGIEELQNRFIITNIDKASNNFGIICKT